MIRAGQLRHSVTIQRAIETRGADGSTAQTWITYASVFAAIEPVSGREYFAAQAEGSDVTHRVTIRYIKGLTTKDRVLFGTRTFDIESILNTGELNAELVLMCSETTT